MSALDNVRYHALLDWLKLNEVETAGLPEMYTELRNEVLARGLVRFIEMPRILSEAFAIRTTLYGESFEAVIDEMI